MAMRTMRAKAEGPDVVLIFTEESKEYVTTMPYTEAYRIVHAIRDAASHAEEFALRDKIITDHAILQRVGTPFGFLRNPVFRKMAEHKAAWDTKLRRYLPGGVKQQKSVGPPSVIKH